MARCLVGCGSNVGGRRDFLDRAMELLRFMPGVRLVRVSRYRDTRPIGGPPGQAAFLNGACLLETELQPHEVMGILAAVENTLHRERNERWGPRTVDLDLLLYDDLVLDTDALTVPHPRMTTRRFVLEPSVEIAPDLVHPLAGCTLERLLHDISSPHPHVAVVGVPGAGAEEVAAAVAHATLARLIAAPPAVATALASTTAPRRMAAAAADPWIAAVETAARPLATRRWPKDPHGTVADHWLHTLRLAADESLGPEPLDRFAACFQAAVADTVPPQVAILLVAPRTALEERGGSRPAPPSSRGAGTAAVCAEEVASVDGLMRLQERLIAALRWPAPAHLAGPRAVVTIAADDLVRASQEAVAAVEAMA